MFTSNSKNIQRIGDLNTVSGDKEYGARKEFDEIHKSLQSFHQRINVLATERNKKCPINLEKHPEELEMKVLQNPQKFKDLQNKAPNPFADEHKAYLKGNVEERGPAKTIDTLREKMGPVFSLSEKNQTFLTLRKTMDEVLRDISVAIRYAGESRIAHVKLVNALFNVGMGKRRTAEAVRVGEQYDALTDRHLKEESAFIKRLTLFIHRIDAIRNPLATAEKTDLVNAIKIEDLPQLLERLLKEIHQWRSEIEKAWEAITQRVRDLPEFGGESSYALRPTTHEQAPSRFTQRDPYQNLEGYHGPKPRRVGPTPGDSRS